MSHKEQEIIQWARDRGILGPHGKATPESQYSKTIEEVRELGAAIAEDDMEGIKDGIGDSVITLMIQARMWGMTLDECIDHAFDQIKDRAGEMINGVFVKNS